MMVGDGAMSGGDRKLPPSHHPTSHIPHPTSNTHRHLPWLGTYLATLLTDLVSSLQLISAPLSISINLP